MTFFASKFVFTNKVDFENIVLCLDEKVYSNLNSVEYIKGEYQIISIILWSIYKLEQKTNTIDEIIDTIKTKTKNPEISVPIVACILGLITGFENNSYIRDKDIDFVIENFILLFKIQ